MKNQSDNSAVSTAPQQRTIGRPFQPGQSGNPSGRPRGSRNQFSEDFIRDFREAWERHGVTALNKVAKEDPAAFVKAGIHILPKQVEADIQTESKTIILLQAETGGHEERRAELEAQGVDFSDAVVVNMLPGDENL